MSSSNDLDTALHHEHNRFLHPGMLVPFVLLVACFAAWGTAANMTDTLVSTFTSVFDDMSTVQATLVQSAYYGAYFLLALPAAFVNQRFNYKVGVLLGLGLAASGGFLFLPAAQAQTFGFFLAAIFALAAGLSILETSANPYVMSMGPESNATRRLNFAQAFNPVGTNTGVLLAALLIAPNLSPLTQDERDTLPPAERDALLTSELDAVMTPYVGLAVVLVLIWVGIAVTKVPGLKVGASHEVDTRGSSSRVKRLLTNTHYSFGVVAQFFNVAAQTCIWTFTITYARDQIGASPTTANWWLQASLIVFLVSRFAMVALMGRFDSRMLMLVMTCLGVAGCLVAVAVPGMVGLVAVVALSACLSLLFPTIYGIALEGLGHDTKFGAAGLVMAIVGGATVPLLQGQLVDSVGSAFSYIVPAGCFVVIVGYAIYTLRAPRPIHETG